MKVKKIKWKYKYKNLMFLGISTFFAVLILRNYFLREILVETLGRLSYLGIFFSGMFLTYGITSPLAASIILILGKNLNILIASILGAIGAVVGDYLIFKFIKNHLLEEIKDLFKNKKLNIKINVPKKLKIIIPIISGLIIASPLPDEIGLVLFATGEYKIKEFFIITFFLHFLGIFSIIYIGKII